MYDNAGLFFPDNFPWPFDSPVAALHKAAVVNGVSGSVVLNTYSISKSLRGSNRGKEAQIQKALGEIYRPSRYFLSYSNTAKSIFDLFPSSVRGPGKYCPACLTAAGFVPALFSLRFVWCCPWHHQPLRTICKRCSDVRRFVPNPFGSPVGFECPDCGYWVPSRAAIFAACRCRAAQAFIDSCADFMDNVGRYARLSVLSVLHYDTPVASQTLSAHSAGPEFRVDPTAKAWVTNLDLTSHDTFPPAPEEDYRCFINFHELRLLTTHRDCICCKSLSRPDLGDQPRSICIYTAALSMFRQKFEHFTNDQTPHLSTSASIALQALAMPRQVARTFFQSVFYRLIAQTWFWTRSTSRFVVHIDPVHFFEILESGRTSGMLDRLLGQRLDGKYRCKLDLPASKEAIRRLLGPGQIGQTLMMRNFGDRAEFTTQSLDRLFFGCLKATAMFYV